jgi:hypothetical protein
MRRNIPRAMGIDPLYSTENVEFFRLEQPPAEWTFSEDGRWNGYSKRED